MPLLGRRDETSILALQRTHGNASVQRLLGVAPSIQRFGGGEHKSLGDNATGSQMVNLGGETGAEKFELTYGDVVSISGDYFEPHQLMEFAKKPGNRGTMKGTRDEVVFALKDAIGSDPRFTGTGIWGNWVFSADVKAAVVSRYQKLAANNASHYAAPRGRDATGAVKPGPAGELGAGGTYRKVHEDALWLAYTAGAGLGGSLSHAMAMEAAAAHFLTDAFSAGHIRTPIGAMREYWGNKYPLFFYNLLHKIALDTAAEINRQDTKPATVLGSVQAIYEKILSKVDKLAGSLPAITVGDLVAEIFHDWDNEKGVAIQGGGRIYGDGFMDTKDPANVTRTRAQDAVKAGTREIDAAFALGASSPGLPKTDVFTKAAAPAAGPAGEYAAEALIPKPDSAEPEQNWMAPTIEALWDKPVVKGSPATIGQRIVVSLSPGGEMRGQLEALAKEFPETEASDYKGVPLGTVRPRLGYTNGFLKPLLPGTGDPKGGILSIVHWAPSSGLGDKDRDDISLATGNELAKGTKRKGENLKGMTTLARIRYVRELTGGSVASDEEELVMKIFETAPPAERPAIYQGVEGHAWTGNWIEGYFKSDDEIYNALRSHRLKRLRDLINQGWSGRP